MRRESGSIVFAVAFLSVLFAAAPAAAQSDHDAVLATVQRLFDGMAAHDTLMLRATLTPEGRFSVIRADTGGIVVSSVSHADFIARMAKTTGKLQERMLNPTVLVNGPIANVWARYDFHQDGAFTHCGTDNFALARTKDGWRITGASFTIEKTGCP